MRLTRAVLVLIVKKVRTGPRVNIRQPKKRQPRLVTVKVVINSNLKYSPAQDGNNYEPTGEKRCPEEQFKKLTPPTWEGKSLPAPDLQLRTLGQGHYCQCVENSANDIFWLVFATLKFSQFCRYFTNLCPPVSCRMKSMEEDFQKCHGSCQHQTEMVAQVLKIHIFCD